MAIPEFLDFPQPPLTLGQKYPPTPVVGVPTYVWDGEKWTTKGGTVGSTGPSNDPPLMDGVAAPGSGTEWTRDDHVHPSDTSRLPIIGGTISPGPLVLNYTPTGVQDAVNKAYADANPIRIANAALLSVNTFDIAVPPTAKQARLTGVVYNTTGASSAVVQVSLEAGVFITTGYLTSGFGYHTAEFGVLTNLISAPKSGMFIYDGANNFAQPVQFDMTIALTRPDVSRVFNSESRAGYFVGADNHHHFYTTYLIPVVHTRVLALRLLSNSNWLAESYLTVDWLG